MIDFFRSLLDLVGQHPHLAVALAFLIAMGEALLIVGLVVPSTVVLTGLGGLAGIGQLPIWPLFAATTLGAVVGDAISYWVGRVYGQRLTSVQPFARYRSMIDAGQRFFANHGGKSVVIGRFIPGIKSVVPAIAGMMGMGNARFTILNVVSAVAWAAAHLVPGYSAGTVLLVAGTVSKRLAILLALGCIVLMLVVWLAHQSIRLGVRALPRLQLVLTGWAATHGGRLAPVVLRLVSPDHADFRLLVILLGLFGSAILGFATIAEDVVTQASGLQLDTAVSQFLQSLRTPWGDRAMVAVTMLGDTTVTIAVTVSAAAALALARRTRLALGLVTTMACASGFALAMKLAIQAPRPAALFSGADAFSFPSGHATSAATLYGALGLVALIGAPAWTGRTVAALLAVLIGAIAFSRVYLAAHWPSDVAAGLLFGAAATSGLALVFRRYAVPPGAAGAALAAAAVALAGAGSWHISRDFRSESAIYAPPPPPLATLSQPWRDGGWRDLPGSRIDLAGEPEEPLLLQWRGSPEALAAALEQLGWTRPPPWSATVLNSFATADTPPVALPVLPSLHNGHRPVLTVVLPAVLLTGTEAGGEQGRYILRAWRRQVRDGEGAVTTILVASITRQAVIHPLGLMSLTLHAEGAPCDATPLLSRLPGAAVVGPRRKAGDGDCGGRTVLADAPGDA